MKSLFKQEVSILKALIAVLLLAFGFYGLTHIAAISFFSIILFGLIATAIAFGPKAIPTLFSKPQKGAARHIIIAVLLSYIYSIAASLIGRLILHQQSAANPIKESFSHGLLNSARVLFKTLFMLCGEEIIVILPLIIIVSLLVHKKIVSEKTAIIIATILTSIMFGAIHLPTYKWNLFQCFVVIGLTRIPFTISSLRSNSIIAGIIGHITYDWIIFFIMIFEAQMGK